MPSSNSNLSILTSGGLSLRPPTACQTSPTAGVSGTVDAKPLSEIKPADAARLAARRHHLSQFIPKSVVFKRAGLALCVDKQHHRHADNFCTMLDDWMDLGTVLEHALAIADDVRVYHYYLPIFFWVLRQLAEHQASSAGRPLVLGLSCPQGGGKTTLTRFLQRLLYAVGRNVHIASLDDFYQPYEDQRRMEDAYPTNRLMRFRGMPGTHDMPLLKRVLDRVAEGTPVCIPSFDKTAYGGRGDRAPRDKWTQTVVGADLVLLEGWCLGFEPVGADNVHDGDLRVVDDALREFGEVYRRMDGLLLVEIEDMEWVYEWRLQAERESRQRGRPGLTDEEVVDFVDRFMPAYKQYSAPLGRREVPLFPGRELHIKIDRQRRPVQ